MRNIGDTGGFVGRMGPALAYVPEMGGRAPAHPLRRMRGMAGYKSTFSVDHAVSDGVNIWSHDIIRDQIREHIFQRFGGRG